MELNKIKEIANRYGVEVTQGEQGKGEIIGMKKVIKVRQIANEICDLFEDLLDEHGIDIPSEDRDIEKEDMTPEEIEEAGFAHLYGSDYFYLEDTITALLMEFAKEIDPDGNVKLDDEF